MIPQPSTLFSRSQDLKADVWRDRLLAEEARLNARLAKLDATPPGEVDARLEEARDEVSVRLADMDAESGPARAAALLAGGFSICLMEPLQGF
jgi:ATP-binding cassette subfamily F protein 3